jgi:exodeoxyribonuclease VII large subunit
VRSKQELQEQLASLRTRLSRGVRFQMLSARQTLTRLAHGMAFARMQELIARRQQRLDELVFRLASAQRQRLLAFHRRQEVASARLRHHDLRSRLTSMGRELDMRMAALGNVLRRQLKHREAQLDRLQSQLQALSPLAILDRGYALIFDEAGNLVTDAAQLAPGSPITARVARGTLTARVERVEPEEG